jgi:hypothetical protein
MLAMIVNENAGHLEPRVVLWFFASMLAPTGDPCSPNKPTKIIIILV